VTDPVFHCPPMDARLSLAQCECNQKRAAKKDMMVSECRGCGGVLSFQPEPHEYDTQGITPVSQVRNTAPKRERRKFETVLGGAKNLGTN